MGSRSRTSPPSSSPTTRATTFRRSAPTLCRRPERDCVVRLRRLWQIFRRRRERVVGRMRAIIVGVRPRPPRWRRRASRRPGAPRSGPGPGRSTPAPPTPSIAGDAVSTHLAYQPTVAAVGKLAVIFPGTSATTLAFSELTRALTGVGYHVIVLRYPNSLGTTAARPDSNGRRPDRFRVYRPRSSSGPGERPRRSGLRPPGRRGEPVELGGQPPHQLLDHLQQSSHPPPAGVVPGSIRRHLLHPGRPDLMAAAPSTGPR